MDDNKFEIVCALVDVSIGYYSVRGAEIEAERYLKGETLSWSERCLACFGGDLRKMVERDLTLWRGLSADRRARVAKLVNALLEEDTATQMTMGLLWPTAV